MSALVSNMLYMYLPPTVYEGTQNPVTGMKSRFDAAILSTIYRKLNCSQSVKKQRGECCENK